MNYKNFSIIIANDDAREKVFAEIWHNGELWAEISQEEEDPIISFFSKNTKYWEFNLQEALEALNRAKEKLLN